MSVLANVLVVAEHDHGALKPATLNTVTAATEVAKFGGGDVHVLIAGHNAGGAAQAAGRIAGVAKEIGRASCRERVYLAV